MLRIDFRIGRGDLVNIYLERLPFASVFPIFLSEIYEKRVGS
jgi:hypothetical protein